MEAHTFNDQDAFQFSKEILTILQDAGFLYWDAHQDNIAVPMTAPKVNLPRPPTPTPFSSKQAKISIDSERTAVAPMDIDDDDLTMRGRLESLTTLNRSEISLQTLRDDTMSTFSKAPTTTTTKTRTVKTNPFAKADFTMRRRINVNASSGSAVRRRSWIPWSHDPNAPQIPLPPIRSESVTTRRTNSSSSKPPSYTSASSREPRYDPYFNPHPSAHTRGINPSTTGIAPTSGQSRLRRGVRRVGKKIKNTVCSAFGRKKGSENTPGFGHDPWRFDEKLALYTMTPSAAAESPASSGFFEAYIAQRNAAENDGRDWVAPISVEAYERRGSWIDEYERCERKAFVCSHPYCHHHRNPGLVQ